MTTSRTAPARLALREIAPDDRDEVVDLLARGYGTERPRAFWEVAFARLAARPVPDPYPRFGYALVSDARIVGVLLLIFARVRQDGAEHVRCNGSSLYVEPSHRLYTPVLTAATNKLKEVTVLNVSAAPHTHRMVEAQGFRPYSRGVFHAVPLAARGRAPTDVRIVAAPDDPGVPVDAWERDLMVEHARYGCDALWCVRGADATPFVFKRQRVKRFARSAQLLYARERADVALFASALGRFYAKRFCFVLTVDGDPLPALRGHHLPDRDVRFFRGPTPPHVGDLAFTELAVMDHGRGW